MAKRKSKEVAVIPQGGAVALPVAWREELAKAAKDEAAKETPAVTGISFKSGILSVGGNPVPGNTMECLVLGTATERSYYDKPYDASNPSNPACFALSIEGDDMVPHENSTDPQAETCLDCPQNEWESAGQGRRGKACKEHRRLALIPADKVESEEDIITAEMAMAKIPITSVPNWSNHVHTVGVKYAMPFWAVFTEISVAPHVKNQFEVNFDCSDTIDDIAALEALKAKRKMVDAFVLAPYSKEAPEDDEAEEEPAPRRKKKKRKF